MDHITSNLFRIDKLYIKDSSFDNFEKKYTDEHFNEIQVIKRWNDNRQKWEIILFDPVISLKNAEDF